MRRVVGPTATGALGVALAIAAVACAVGAGRAADDADQARQGVRYVTVLQVRTASERAYLDEVNATLLHDVFDIGSERAVVAARDRRVAARRQAVAALTAISRGSDTAGRDASDLLNVVANDGIGSTRIVDPDALVTAADFDLYVGQGPTRPVPSGIATDLDDLVAVASIGGWTLNRGIDLTWIEVRPDVPSRFGAYLDLAEQYALSGGFLGDDADRPLQGSVYLADSDGSARTRSLDRIVARSPIMAYDQWIQRRADGPAGDPPATLADLASTASRLDAALRGRIDAALADERAAAAAARDRAERRHDRLALAAIGLGALAALCLLASAAMAIARIRARSRQATTDPLTGVGNRRRLDEATRAHLADPDLAWHAVAMVDLDRFKLINDTWGHATGDAVLVRLAQELQSAAADLRSSPARPETTVVRMGGDEFLVSVHARTPMDVGAIRDRLGAARSVRLFTADGHEVPLAFSVGVASAAAPCTLEDLMAAADLASYEEKAQRAQRATDDGVGLATTTPTSAASTDRR